MKRSISFRFILFAFVFVINFSVAYVVVLKDMLVIGKVVDL